MALNVKKNFEYIVVHEHQVDLTKASYAPELTSTDLDEDTGRFHATVDRVLFKKPLEIVTKVLEANGFVINLENLLAALDHFTLVTKISLNERFQAEQTPSVRHFLPCIQFELPNKSKKGSLLKQFYAEIESYELEIARLQDGDDKKPGEKAKSREQLKREFERLQMENAKLKGQVGELSQKLGDAIKSQVSVERALESHNIIPPQLRAATVREINFHDRTILLKANRTNVPVPMALLHELPAIGDACLVHIEDSATRGVFFYQKEGRAFDVEVAEVLYCGEDFCKIRNGQRRVFNLHAQNDVEKSIAARLKRGDKILLHSIDGHLIRFEDLRMPLSDRFTHRVQEQIALHQLEIMDAAQKAAALKRQPKRRKDS